MAATGAKPSGVEDEAGAARAVREMFDSIAPRYDLLNHVLSANIDRLWWWRTARRFQSILADPDAAVLDICCGTGDMTMALLKHRPRGARPILAADFARGMLSRGARKFAASAMGNSHAGAPFAIPLEADALHLPVRSGSLDLVVSAFGFRNLVNYDAALRELHRVLKPGGELGILECNRPRGVLGRLYLLYFERVLPWIGRRVSGSSGAYSYLPASVARFPQPPEMIARMKAAGFSEARWTRYTFGVAGLYRGLKG